MKTIITAAVAALAVVGLTACAPQAEPEPEVGVTDTPEVVEETTMEEPTEGTRENPLPLGSEVVGSEWTVTVNGANLDATDDLLAINQMNETPPEGYTHIMVDLTIEYTGADEAGAYTEYTIDYVTVDGNTIELAWLDVGPEEFTTLSELYPGATHTGWMPFTVPADSAGQGVLAVTPDMSSEKVFVALS